MTESPLFTNGYALLIGVGSYMHVPSADIPISVADAKKTRDILCDPALCGYLPEHVDLLHDATATRDRILTGIDALISKTTPEDTVLLFYCGHGEYDTEGAYNLTTHDTQIDWTSAGARVSAGTGISETELTERLRLLPAQRLLFLFNACHSGELSPELSFGEDGRAFGDLSLPESSTENLLSTGQGRIIITACRPNQKSLIGAGALTIFTQAVLDGFTGKGDVGGNHGYVSAFQLYEHVYHAVKEAADALGRIQEPELTVLRGVGPFPVSLYRGGGALGRFDTRESLPSNTAVREIVELSQTDLEELADLLVRSGKAERSSRRALAYQIGVDPHDLAFLVDGADRSFAHEMVYFLHEAGDFSALARLCTLLERMLKGPQLERLNAVHARLE